MGKSKLKINATALVYNTTENETYKDNVFIDDKYLDDFDINKVQISSVSDTNDVLYALSSGFDVQVDNLALNSFSFMNVLHENYNDLKNTEISMQIRMREIGVTIDSAKEFISLVNSTKDLNDKNNVSFAGILFSTNKASILNTGKARIYLYRNKYLKLISAHPEQVEDIIKNGTLNIDNLENNNIHTEYQNSKVLSENFVVEAGDVYILCNEGSSEAISDDNIYEQLGQKKELNQAIAYLVKLGISEHPNKNISMIALEVESIVTDVKFPAQAAFVASAGGNLGAMGSDSEKNIIINELLHSDEEESQSYSEAGIPFIGANYHNGYGEYGSENEAKINKKMVFGVIALSLLLVALLVTSGLLINAFLKRGTNISTYNGIVITSQPTEEVEATLKPTAKSPVNTDVTTPVPTQDGIVITQKPIATVKPIPTPKPTAKPTDEPTEPPTVPPTEPPTEPPTAPPVITPVATSVETPQTT